MATDTSPTGRSHLYLATTPEQDALLIESWNRDQSGAAAAGVAGVSRHVANRRLEELGVKTPQRRPWAERELKRLRRDFVRYRDDGRLGELAEQMDRPLSSMKHKAGELGLQKENIRWSRMSEQEARIWFDRYVRSKLSVLNFCTRHGITQHVQFSETMKRYFGDDYRNAVERAWPKHTWYVRGRDFELRTRKHLERNGYPHVVRSFRSRGPADLTAVGPAGTLLVQCKRGGYMGPAEHNELWELAERAGATPILSGMPDGRTLRFWVLTGSNPGSRGGRRPIREISFPWSPSDDLPAAAAA